MSATPTEAERQKAYEVWNEALCNSGIPGWHHADAFAQALADQRDRHEAVVALRVAQALADQRARYEALANELERDGRRYMDLGKPYASGLGDARTDAAKRIRQVAMDGQS